MTDRKGDFFSALARKLRREPARAADQRFWARFDQEFGKSRSSERWTLKWSLMRIGPVAAALVVSIGGFWLYRDQQPDVAESRMAEAAMAAHQEMFEEYELFAEFDSVELPLEDEEWNELLADTGAG